MLTRRQFFQSLAASVVAAGMPLPVGFPQQHWTLVWTGEMVCNIQTVDGLLPFLRDSGWLT